MSTSYEFIGRIKQIGQTQSYGANNFQKREVVVCDEDARYPQDVAFSFVRDRCSILDQYQIGDMVKVTFDIRGREYNGRHFVDLNGWRMERADTVPGGGVAPAPAAAAPAPAAGGYAPAPAPAPAPAVGGYAPAPAPVDVDPGMDDAALPF